MIQSKDRSNIIKLARPSPEFKFVMRIISFGLAAGLVSSIGISTLIVMVEKVTAIPVGAFYIVLVSAITQSYVYSIYMIIAGLLLHLAAGGFIGIIMAIPFAIRVINNDRKGVIRTINRYAPVYGLCFGFVLWILLFIPITYFMVIPALNNIKQAPAITQQDPTGRTASLLINDVLSMENKIVIGALAFNMFYGLVAAIVINSLYTDYLNRKSWYKEDIVDQ
jgi:hypothetical protein